MVSELLKNLNPNAKTLKPATSNLSPSSSLVAPKPRPGCAQHAKACCALREPNLFLCFYASPGASRPQTTRANLHLLCVGSLFEQFLFVQVTYTYSTGEQGLEHNILR